MLLPLTQAKCPFHACSDEEVGFPAHEPECADQFASGSERKKQLPSGEESCFAAVSGDG